MKASSKAQRENRDEVLQVRLSKSELEEVRQAAQAVALDTSTFARTVLIQHVRNTKAH